MLFSSSLLSCYIFQPGHEDEVRKIEKEIESLEKQQNQQLRPVLTKEELQSIDKSEDCMVCLDGFGGEDTRDVYKTSCGHLFHRECLAKYARAKEVNGDVSNALIDEKEFSDKLAQARKGEHVYWYGQLMSVDDLERKLKKSQADLAQAEAAAPYKSCCPLHCHGKETELDELKEFHELEQKIGTAKKTLLRICFEAYQRLPNMDTRTQQDFENEYQQYKAQPNNDEKTPKDFIEQLEEDVQFHACVFILDIVLH